MILLEGVGEQVGFIYNDVLCANEFREGFITAVCRLVVIPGDHDLVAAETELRLVKADKGLLRITWLNLIGFNVEGRPEPRLQNPVDDRWISGYLQANSIAKVWFEFEMR